MMLRGVAVVAALVLAAGPAWAGESVIYAPVPEWVKAAELPERETKAQAGPRFVIFDQQHRLSAGERWQYFDSAQRVASTEMLKEVGTLAINWQPERGDLRVHRLEIIRRGEVIDLLKQGQKFQVLKREPGLEQQWLDGQLTATLAIEGLRVGDILRFAASITSADPVLGKHVETVLPLLPKPLQISFGRARLVWDDSVQLTTRTYVDGVTLAPPRSTGGLREVEVTLPIAKLPEIPGDAPVRFQPLPILEASDFASWSDLSRLMAPYYQTNAAITPDGALAKEVARIRALSADPRVRAAKALQVVQDEVRYLYRGMDGGNYRPQAPEQTWSLRYGDCKAKTLLLLAMLDALGIEAEPVLVNSRLGDGLPGRLPSAGAFDHVIVHARIDGKSLWLDGTMSGQRLEDIEDIPFFRHVLPLRGEGAELIEMPGRPRVRPDMAVVFEVDDSAGVQFPEPFTIEVGYRGDIAVKLEQARSQVGNEELAKIVEQLIKPFVESGTITRHAIRYDAASGIATVRAEGIAYSDWSQRGDRWTVPIGLVDKALKFDPDRGRAAWKNLPVVVGPPGKVESTVRIKLPAGAGSTGLEGALTTDVTVAGSRWRRETAAEGQWRVVEEESETLEPEIAAAEIGRTKDAVAQVKAAAVRAFVVDPKPRWQHVAEAKGTRRFDAILTGYATDIAETPDEARPYYHRAWFKSSIYDWAGALADMNRAIEMEPSTDYLLERANIHRALAQDEQALADVQAALELEPGSRAAISRLVVLEELAPPSDTLDLIGDRASASSDEGRAFLRIKAQLLSRMNDPDGAIAALTAAIEASPNSDSLLNERCWLKGLMNVSLDTAMVDCNRAIELGRAPSAALDSRALIHLRMNDLDRALADLDAALKLAPDQASSLYLRGIVRKLKGERAQSTADLAASRLIWPRIDAEMGRWGVKP
ncbi:MULTISPECIES: DUF3857 domain-containing protein [unclassified Sphingomonas]|jgi:tetratricopeptide (TPR) repeat protein|uniref:DUF3857 domain-containing protein n=1 Tax=unclassified Sphingomonas TaxID=196159 RepID=UPI000830092E|nr:MULTISPECIES: DUF3857 domain-containing protein [unclassified Sphingomonas]